MIVLITAVVTYLLYGYISGIEIHNAVEYAFLTKNGYDQYVSKYMERQDFEHFNHTELLGKAPHPKEDLKLRMLFSINDIFRSGVIWMKYSYTLKDEHGKMITGSFDVPVKLHLKGTNGHWRIVEIEEAP